MNRRLPVLLFLGALAWAEAARAASVAVWDTSVRATGGLGYRDNVLRSSFAPEGGGFFLTSADLSVLRLTDTGSLFSFFLLGEDTRYFDVPAVGYEQYVSGQAEVTTPVGERNEAGVAANYLYQHQILDVSETEAIRRRVLVEGHGATVRPHWKHTVAEGWAVQLEGALMRQVYESELDDYWEGSGRLSLIREYGNRSEASLACQALLRPYDTREQYDASGADQPGTDLEYRQREIAGRWRHHWDAARRWRTTSKLGYMNSQDNGSGYFDYDRIQLSEQVRWGNPVWEIKATARGGWYSYPVQQVGNERLERSYVVIDGRIERRLGKNWLLYAVAEHEWNLSNDPLGEYETWMAGGGAGFEF